MKYTQPVGAAENAPYINANPAAGIEGSPVPAEAVEHPQREIVHVIEEAGLTPDPANLEQLTLAIRKLILEAIPPAPDRYELCEFYPWRHPDLKPGFQPAQGGLLENAATLYPDAWAYLQTAEGQKLCKTEAEWQALTTATWATLADGTKVGWNGIGGAPFYAPNTPTGALRLPDLRGMYAEAAGFDSLGVGGTHGDAMRNVMGGLVNVSIAGVAQDAFAILGRGSSAYGQGSSPVFNVSLDASRVVPTANKVQGRAWGSLACVYLGAPR